MKFSGRICLFLASILGLTSVCSAEVGENILKSRTFHASFDSGTDADTAKGDGKLYTVIEKEGKLGLLTDEATVRVETGGLSGGAMKFTKREAPWIYYKASGNVPYAKTNWSGSVSCWLKLDPEQDLEPGYCDPIQLTTRAWNDGSFFVDFDESGDWPAEFRSSNHWAEWRSPVYWR